jgi:hypothetical protein
MLNYLRMTNVQEIVNTFVNIPAGRSCGGGSVLEYLNADIINGLFEPGLPCDRIRSIPEKGKLCQLIDLEI